MGRLIIASNRVPEADGGTSAGGLVVAVKAAFQHADGLWFGWEERKSWLHVRPSNTEPVVRAIAEAPTRDEAARLCDAVAALLS